MYRWQDRYHAAKTALSGRDDAIAAAAEAVEVRLQLLGCTAIEDKLQAGVPETIANLAAAGIRLWVLTGDKQARSESCPAHLQPAAQSHPSSSYLIRERKELIRDMPETLVHLAAAETARGCSNATSRRAA